MDLNRYRGRFGGVSERLRRRVVPPLQIAEIFPSIEDEFGPYRHLFTGNVLNAGAGNRDITPLIDGHLYNQDIAGGLHSENIDFIAPLHEVPTADAFFDTVICNAVLEHVANPEEVMSEFARILAPGGALYLTIPFRQPEHRDPTDYQRYTIDGIKLLCERHGFRVLEAAGVHSVYTTLAWIFHEWLEPVRGLRGLAMRAVAYRWVMRQIRAGNPEHVASLASAHRVIAIRLG
jgi:SAM-dependent methyltransferase